MYRLREIERKDLERINEWRNEPELIAFLGAPYRYINIEVDEKWYQGYLESRNNTVRCAVIDETDEILGLVSLTSVDYLCQSAVFNIIIGSNAQNKGAGSFGVKEMLKHAFYNMNLNRVELAVLETNHRAIHLYEKNGFIKEGTKRQARYKNGQHCDIHIYSILREEYEQLEKD